MKFRINDNTQNEFVVQETNEKNEIVLSIKDRLIKKEVSFKLPYNKQILKSLGFIEKTIARYNQSKLKKEYKDGFYVGLDKNKKIKTISLEPESSTDIVMKFQPELNIFYGIDKDNFRLTIKNNSNIFFNKSFEEVKKHIFEENERKTKKDSDYAKYLAFSYHWDQKYGNYPYKKHLKDVWTQVGKICHFVPIEIDKDIENNIPISQKKIDSSYNIDLIDRNDAQIVSILHDAIEDTSLSLDLIKRNFNENIYKSLNLITDVEGETREEIKKNTYEKWVNSNYSVIDPFFIVKIADRCANISMGLNTPDKKSIRKLKRYIVEYEGFKKALGILEFTGWGYLDDLMEKAKEKVNENSLENKL